MRIFITLVCAVLVSCGGGSPNNTGSSQAPGEAPTAQVTNAVGGIVTFSDPALSGLQLRFPPNALSTDVEVVSAAAVSQLPGAVQAALLAAGAVQVGPVFQLKTTGSGNFAQPVLLRLPFDSKLSNGEDLVPTVWDTSLNTFVPLEVVDVDTQGGYVYFLTSHFSSFVLFKTRASMAAVDTGFTPHWDAFRHPNAYTVYTDGDCFGISAYAAWHWRKYRSGNLSDTSGALKPQFGGGDDLFFADNTVRELMTAAQLLTLQANVRTYRAFMLSDDNQPVATKVFDYFLFPAGTAFKNQFTSFQAKRLVNQLRAAGPQLFLLGGFRGSANGQSQDGRWAHAVLVYSWTPTSDTSGTFLAYDSDLSGQILTIKWSADDGFRVMDHYSTADRFWVTASETWFRGEELQKIEDAANSSKVLLFSQSITLENLPIGSGGFACVQGDQQTACNVLLSPVTDKLPSMLPGRPLPSAFALRRTADGSSLLLGNLTGGGTSPSVARIDGSQLSNQGRVQLIVAGAPQGVSLNPEFIDATGRMTGYRAYLDVALQPAKLTVTKTGGTGQTLVLGAFLSVGELPGAKLVWKRAGQVFAEGTSSVVISGGVPSGTVFTVMVKETAEDALNPEASYTHTADACQEFPLASSGIQPPFNWTGTVVDCAERKWQGSTVQWSEESHIYDDGSANFHIRVIDRSTNNYQFAIFRITDQKSQFLTVKTVGSMLSEPATRQGNSFASLIGYPTRTARYLVAGAVWKGFAYSFASQTVVVTGAGLERTSMMNQCEGLPPNMAQIINNVYAIPSEMVPMATPPYAVMNFDLCPTFTQVNAVNPLELRDSLLFNRFMAR